MMDSHSPTTSHNFQVFFHARASFDGLMMRECCRAAAPPPPPPPPAPPCLLNRPMCAALSSPLSFLFATKWAASPQNRLSPQEAVPPQT